MNIVQVNKPNPNGIPFLWMKEVAKRRGDSKKKIILLTIRQVSPSGFDDLPWMPAGHHDTGVVFDRWKR